MIVILSSAFILLGSTRHNNIHELVLTFLASCVDIMSGRFSFAIQLDSPKTLFFSLRMNGNVKRHKHKADVRFTVLLAFA